MSYQALLPANLGDFHRSCHSLRLCFIPFWMACSREGNPPSNHSFQLTGIERPTIPRCISAPRGSWTRVTVSSIIHSCRVPCEGCLYHFLVDTVSSGLRPACASVVSTSRLLARPIFSALHYGFDPSHHLLLSRSRNGLRKEI